MVWMSFALAQQVDLTPGAKRSFEVEAWREGRTQRHAWNSDWTLSPFEALAGVLECEMQKGRYEQCRWKDDRFYWGHGETPESLKVFEVPFDAMMELKWSKNGKLSTWDIRGDGRDAFAQQYCNLQVQELFHKAGFVCMDDTIRRLGPQMEESLLKLTVGWLEVQWPKAPAEKWAPRSPITGPRWFRYGVSSHDLKYRKLEDQEWVMEGKIVERPDAGGAVETFVAAVYQWEGNELRSMVGQSVTGSTTVELRGHRGSRVELRAVDANTDPRPDRLPEMLIKQGSP